jgi:hypothetical protein
MRLNPGQTQTVHIEAIKTFGGDPVIEVKQGEKYSFTAAEGKTWTDWFIPSTAKGFWNIILPDSMKRVRGAKCFELCGTINEGEENHFRIGMYLPGYTITVSGDLYFFPNDSIKHYGNNKGYMKVVVKRES